MNFSSNTANFGKSRDLVLAVMCAFCGSSFNFKTSFLIVLAAASDSRQRFIARDQSDLLFDHISHVVTSGFFLSETILKIKHNFRENFSCLIWEQLYEGKIQDRVTDVQFVESNNSKVSMLILNFLWRSWLLSDMIFAGEYRSSYL